MDICFALAAALSLITCGVHFFAGGREIAKPLLSDEAFAPVVKYTLYYCWHMVTIALLGMFVGFALAAYNQEFRVLAMEWTIFAALFATWNIALALWKKQSLLKLVQWALFLPITALGLAGLWL